MLVAELLQCCIIPAAAAALSRAALKADCLGMDATHYEQRLHASLRCPAGHMHVHAHVHRAGQQHFRLE